MYDCEAAGDSIRISETSGSDLVISRLIIFKSDQAVQAVQTDQSDQNCTQYVLDNVSVPDLIATINDGSPVEHQLLAEGICGALTYAIKDASKYSNWLLYEPDSNKIILAPGSDATPGKYSLFLQVSGLEIPFQATVKPEDDI